jgi:hypothetical protein
MDAKTLPLPDGGSFHAQYIDDMREIGDYHIERDEWVGSWHTVINGKQYFATHREPVAYGTLEDFLARTRGAAHDALLAIENS